MTRSLSRFGFVGFVALGALLCAGSHARAQEADPAVLAKVKDLNKKGIDAYENLDLEEARKILMQALETCASEGLNNHPLKATTHMNLGAVLVGGLKQRDLGIRQFKRAIEIDPTTRVTKRLSNPDIQSAFEEAAKGGEAPKPGDDRHKPEPVNTPPREDPKPAPTDGSPPKKITGVFHEPLTEAKPSSSVTVKAAVESALSFDKVILAYRPDGASDFLAREMEKDDKGWYVARIPEPATQGGMVAYYIEARSKSGQAVAGNGSAAEPHLISLAAVDAVAADGTSPDAAVSENPDDPGAKDEPGDGARKFMLIMGLGGGYGYASGTPEVNRTGKDGSKLGFSGWAPAPLVHLAPELGYFVTPEILLSVQFRLQIVTGATEVRDESCKPTGVCAPAKGALAGLVRATWVLGKTGGLRPWLAMSAGGGDIRHLIKLDGQGLKDCGPSKTDVCTDTVLGGNILLGPAGGIFFEVNEKVTLTASVNTLAGFPNSTFNVDGNVGVAVGF